jgi:hypothetical protein
VCWDSRRLSRREKSERVYDKNVILPGTRLWYNENEEKEKTDGEIEHNFSFIFRLLSSLHHLRILLLLLLHRGNIKRVCKKAVEKMRQELVSDDHEEREER